MPHHPASSILLTKIFHPSSLLLILPHSNIPAEAGGIQWRSAVMGGQDDDVATSRKLPAKSLKSAKWSVFGRSGHIRLQSDADMNHPELRLDGFPATDYDKVRQVFKQLYDLDVAKHPMSSAGYSFGNVAIESGSLVYKQCVLEDADEEGEEFEPRDGEEMMSVNLAEVSQCVLPGNNRNEIELQFHETDTVEAGTDQLVAIRLYIPPDADADPSDRDAPTAAELFQQRIMKNANIKKTTGDVIVEFDEAKGTFLTPRGRYAIELYGSYLRMRGAKYDYRIKYDDISRLFLLPKPDDVHMAFVIALDKPIRQGQQRYQYLVLQTNKEQAEVTVNLEEDVLEKEYNNDLQPVMYGALSNLIAKTFKIIAKKKVFIPGKFANANQQACVKCALRASEGHLYPLEKQFIFIHKPTVLIRFDEVDYVEFQRYGGGQGSTRNFDLCVSLRGSEKKEYIFSGIDRSDYNGLYNFLSGKKIRIKNLQEAEPAPSGPIYDENVIYGLDADGGQEMEESSDDEDYGTGDDESESDDMSDESGDDDDLGSGFEDSDLEEFAKKGKAAKKKKSKKKADSDDDSNAGGKKRKKAKGGKSPKKKKRKKDPNAPKRGLSAFMFFSKEMRPKIQEKNPEASFGETGKLLGEAWKNVTDEEKKKFEDMAEADKGRYKKAMESYVPPSDDDDDSSEDEGASKKKKGKKGAKKDPNAPKRALSAFMFFSQEMRPKVKEENAEASFGELGKLIGVAWKNVSEEEKKKYEDMNKEDKERYDKEMAAYKAKKKSEPTKPAAKDDSDDSDDSDSDSDDSE